MELKGPLWREWSVIRLQYSDTIAGDFVAEVLRFDVLAGNGDERDSRRVIGFDTFWALVWIDNNANQWIESFDSEFEASQRLAQLVFATARDRHVDDVTAPKHDSTDHWKPVQAVT